MPSSASIGQIQQASPQLSHGDASISVPGASDMYEEEPVTIIETGDMSNEEDNSDTETDEPPSCVELNTESGDSDNEIGAVQDQDANEPLDTEVSSEHETRKEVEESPCQSNPILEALLLFTFLSTEV